MSHDHDHGADPELCVCFHVPVRKVVSYCRKNRPPVASRISECFSAGTGCGWCVPYLQAIFEEQVRGGPPAAIPLPDEYRRMRETYRKTGDRPA